MLSILLLLPLPAFLKYMDYQSYRHYNSDKAHRREISLLYYQDWQHFVEKGLHKSRLPCLGWNQAVQTLPTAPCPWSGATSRLVLAFPIAQRLPLQLHHGSCSILQNCSALDRRVGIGVLKHTLWCYLLSLLVSILYFLLLLEPSLEAAVFTGWQPWSSKLLHLE